MSVKRFLRDGLDEAKRQIEVLRIENERLRKALEDVKKHREQLCGSSGRWEPLSLDTDWVIADEGLKGES